MSNSEERFWSKVDIRSADECWEWQGGLTASGYGNFSVGGKNNPEYRQWPAHRYSWFITNGELPDSVVVCHRCDNRRCVNPNHLFLGKQAANMRDKVSKGRQAKGSSHGASKVSEADIQVMVETYNGGKSQYNIAEMFGISQATVSHILRRELWRHVDVERAELRPGSGSTKLTWGDVNSIREAADSGASTSTLANKYGVTARHIRKIVSGEIWRQPE